MIKKSDKNAPAPPTRRKPPVRKKQPNSLTPRQKIFVREYLRDMNATQAYLRAGYRVHSDIAAGVNGARLLKNAYISETINKHLQGRLEKLKISNDTVLQEIAKMAFCNMFDYITIRDDGSATIDFKNLTREQAAAIQELSYEEALEAGDNGSKPVKKMKFKLTDKKGSLEMLGKYLKLFNETTPTVSRQSGKILKSVLDGQLTAREAAYRFNILGLPIPEVLTLELGKLPPELPPPELPPAMEDAELEAGYRKQMEKTDEQEKQWLPERKQDVQVMKDELRGIESFGPEAEIHGKRQE